MAALILDRAPERCSNVDRVRGLTVVTGHDGSTTGMAVVRMPRGALVRAAT
jgi:hypothetical protein